MTNRLRWIVVCGLLWVVPAVAAGEPAGLDKKLSLDLAAAAARDVFSSFASMLGAEPVLDPELEGPVTIKLDNVTARTSLNALCEMLDCKWWLEEGTPPRFVVKAQAGPGSGETGPPGNLATPVTLSLRDAPVEEVFRSFAKIGRWKLVLEKTTVSLELEDTPVGRALDEVCAQVDCVWTLETVGDEGVLRIDWID